MALGPHREDIALASQSAETTPAPQKKRRRDSTGNPVPRPAVSCVATGTLTVVFLRIRWGEKTQLRKDAFSTEADASAFHWKTLAQIEVALKSAKAERRRLEVRLGL